MQLFQSQDQHYAIRSVLAGFENLNRGTFQKMLMPAVNEPTFSGHIRKLITPCAWATHVEVIAAATYFQVPVYECCLDPSKTKYRWECIAPQSPPSHFRHPEVSEDMFTREAVVPNHFELVYIHDCLVSQETVNFLRLFYFHRKPHFCNRNTITISTLSHILYLDYIYICYSYFVLYCWLLCSIHE